MRKTYDVYFNFEATCKLTVTGENKDEAIDNAEEEFFTKISVLKTLSLDVDRVEAEVVD